VSRSVRLILGPPGTGKTTTLLDLVKREADQVATQAIGFMSFSRRAVKEARERLGATEDDFPYFRTLHSMAFRLCELNRRDVMQPSHFVAFSNLTGVPLKAPPSEEDPSRGWEGEVGDQALSVYGRSRSRGTPVREEWEASKIPGLTWEQVRYVVTAYEEFKRDSGLWDFHDMIERAQGVLPVETFFLDEAQDTSSAQWAFLRRVLPDSCRVIVAGDDDQCVYGWSGASSEMLQRLRGDVQILPVSHRLPVAVKRVADAVSAQIRRRVPKEFAPRPDPGSVLWLKDPDRVDLTDGKTHLLLARSNYQLGVWRTMARRQGVIYSLPSGEWSWSLPSVRAAYAFEALRRGDLISRNELALINRYLDHKVAPTRDRLTWSDVFPDETRGVPWFDALTAMPEGDREYIRKVRARGESMKEPGRVRIGTVHSVKGAEAEVVTLLTDVSYRADEARKVDPDAELRVLYVGVTRASERLQIVHPQTPRHWRVFPA